MRNVKLAELFTERLYRIPDYQRGYAWETVQLDDFWGDLENLNSIKRTHYIGAITLQKAGQDALPRESNWLLYDVYHVVDGQQRLTTILILLCAILRAIRSCPIHRGADCRDIKMADGVYMEAIISQFIRRDKDGKQLYFLDYCHNANETSQYLQAEIFSCDDKKTRKIAASDYYTKKLQAAKAFFDEKLATQDEPALQRLYLKLKQGLVFSEYKIESDEEVCLTFETINNRGKKLSLLELLKNRLIYLTILLEARENKKKTNLADMRERISKSWGRIYRSLGKSTTGALVDDEFLEAHWIMYFFGKAEGQEFHSHLLRTMFDAKKVIAGKINVQEILDYAESLATASEAWCKMRLPTNDATLTDKEIRWLHRLKHIGTASSFRPLLMAALANGKQGTSEFVELLQIVERFCFVFFCLGGSNANLKRKKFYQQAYEMYKDSKPLAEIIDEIKQHDKDATGKSVVANKIESFVESLERPDYYGGWSAIKYFLFEYAASLGDAEDWALFGKSRGIPEALTLEHIRPTNPRPKEWENLGHGTQKYVGALGNLLLLTQSQNSSVGNKDYEEKRKLYRKAGKAAKEVAKETAWNRVAIEKRSRKLLKFLNERWNLGLTTEQLETMMIEKRGKTKV